MHIHIQTHSQILLLWHVLQVYKSCLLFPTPSGHQVSAMPSLPVPLLLITAALVLPRGKLTSLLSYIAGCLA